MANLKQIYNRRFDGEQEFRNKMYSILCKNFFQKFIKPTDAVLDIGAGQCEFINNIAAKEKFAYDKNPDVHKFAEKNVLSFCEESVCDVFKKENLDVIYISNLLEHLTRHETEKLLKDAHMLLKPEGRLLILQPNYRYCSKDYFQFWDHITPIDDRALTEILELSGFRIKTIIPRFLPYTTKGSLPKSLFLLRVYLSLPFLWRFFGGQCFVEAEKCLT